jgi:hypothetical protein
LCYQLITPWYQLTSSCNQLITKMLSADNTRYYQLKKCNQLIIVIIFTFSLKLLTLTENISYIFSQRQLSAYYSTGKNGIIYIATRKRWDAIPVIMAQETIINSKTMTWMPAIQIQGTNRNERRWRKKNNYIHIYVQYLWYLRLYSKEYFLKLLTGTFWRNYFEIIALNYSLGLN